VGGHRPLNATLSAVVTEADRDERGGVSEALRSAVERTFAATVDSASETREKASELLDDAARRGQEAREEVARRSQEARDEVTRRSQEAREEVARRGQEAKEAPRALFDRIGSALGLGGSDSELREENRRLRRRVAELEKQLKSKSKL
jgi:polyhydroxyalkanoate synthesis regulator phasin